MESRKWKMENKGSLRSELYCVMENIIEKKSFDFAIRIV